MTETTITESAAQSLSFEPTPLRGITELRANRKGYTSRLTEVQGTAVTFAIILMLGLMLWGLAEAASATLGPGTPTAAIIVFGGFGVPLAIHFYSEWWLKRQFTPAVSVVDGFVPGRAATVEIAASPSRIRRVEVVATVRKTGKNHKGRTTSTNVRVAERELHLVEATGGQPVVTYTADVPRLANRRVTWIIAVHLRGRPWRYVRPFPVLPSLSDAADAPSDVASAERRQGPSRNDGDGGR